MKEVLGDEVGLFDENGIVDSNGNIGEILVGAGTWNGSQLEVVAIQGVNLSQFGGPILPGFQDGNALVVKVYRPSTGMEYDTDLTFSAGSGTFGDFFMAISEIVLDDGSIDICEDESACNTGSESDCEYAEENFDCDGNCLVDVDCAGECGGSAELDECGVCDGLGIPDGECDCDGNVEDCLGECGGDAVVDECGE